MRRAARRDAAVRVVDRRAARDQHDAESSRPDVDQRRQAQLERLHPPRARRATRRPPRRLERPAAERDHQEARIARQPHARGASVAQRADDGAPERRALRRPRDRSPGAEHQAVGEAQRVAGRHAVDQERVRQDHAREDLAVGDGDAGERSTHSGHDPAPSARPSIETSPSGRRWITRAPWPRGAPGVASVGSRPPDEMSNHDAADSLDALAQILEALRATRSRLEKRRLLVEYLQALPDEALPLAVTYLGGRPFPRGDGRVLSIGGATLDAALRAARPELTDEAVGAAWRRHADAGDVAAELWTGVTPADPAPLRLTDVAESFAALHAARGARAKSELLVAALRRMTRARSAFVKAMLGEARIGAQEQTLEDAVAHATGQTTDAVGPRTVTGPISGAVALDARRGRLEPARFAYFTPVDPMFAQPAADVADAVRRLGTPLWVGTRWTRGVRCQLHKVDADVRLYSRYQRDLSRQFPEVVAA